jgi:hypothetical protein
MENTSISDLYQFDSSPFTEDKECVMDKFLESHYKGIYCFVRRRINDNKVFVELYDYFVGDSRKVIAILEFDEGESFLQQEVKACVSMYLLFKRESIL